ncbi:MAG: hypothetical protein U0Y68_08300 [Blastocatellia bacterium]
MREGVVTGLRIDHIDGLLDPERYLEQLHRICRRHCGSGAVDSYVVVEKILGPDERRAQWATQAQRATTF